MNLYLNNQKRDRDLDEYLEKLCINHTDFSYLNKKDSHLLLVGGGQSLLKEQFIASTLMRITNIDLMPPDSNPEGNNNRLINKKGDFLKTEYVDAFDEIWALCSLPLYAQSIFAAYLFVFKSILAIKPTGCVRFFPLELNSVNRMHTKDADYDISAVQLSGAVLDAIKIVESLGVSVMRVKYQSNIKGTEEAVILKINASELLKNKINSTLTFKIARLFPNENYMGVNVVDDL